MYLRASVLAATVFLAMAKGDPHTVIEPNHTFGIYHGKSIDVKRCPYTDNSMYRHLAVRYLVTRTPENGNEAAIYSKSDEIFRGNGVVLNRNWILVTAYQVHRMNVDNLAVRVASNYALIGGRTYNVSAVVVHEDFSRQYYSDIALLKTSTKIVFLPTAIRLILAHRAIVDNSTGLVTGFGSNKESPDYLLREANFTVIRYNVCVTYYNFLPSKGVFCADSDVYTAAYDDMGAPFLIGNVLAGTLLGGYGSYPGIYNDMFYWKDWINRQITSTSQDNTVY